MPTLILTPRFTQDAQALWRAAIHLGWSVRRLQNWRVPDEFLKIQDPVFYLEGLFAPTLAAMFGRKLIEPPLNWLPQLPERYRRREIVLSTLGNARRDIDRAFVKPPNDKSFEAGIYASATLPDEFDDDTPVLISDIVRWEKEFRFFILNREIKTQSIYLRDGELQRSNDFRVEAPESYEASKFVKTILQDTSVQLGRTAVIDVGVIEGKGWAVIEQNAAWGSGIYGCDPAKVLEVLRFAHTED